MRKGGTHMKKRKNKIISAILLSLCTTLIGGNVALAQDSQNVAKEVTSVIKTDVNKFSYEQDIATATNIEEIDIESAKQNAVVTVSEEQPGFTNYVFESKEPLDITQYRSGETEEAYSITTIAVKSSASSGTDEVMDNGDIALYGRIEYVKAYEADDTAKANEFAKLTKVQTKAYNFRESGVHNLKAYPMCWGEQANSNCVVLKVGQESFSNPKINVASPSEGTLYSNSNLGFQYYYRTAFWGVLKADFMVNYRHGNSVYMVSATAQYGTGPAIEP